METINRLAAALLFFLAGYALFLSTYHPFHNWDAIGYIGAAESHEQGDLALLHTFTYAALRHALPATEYEDLAREQGPGEGKGGAYRHAISTDASAFGEQLPFYQIRPAYTGLIFLLHKAGVDIEFATHLVSGLAVAMALILLCFVATPVLSKTCMWSLAPLVIVFGVLDLARYSTPDGLALLAIMLIVCVYLRGQFGLLLVMLPAVLAVRTDLLLFTLPLLFALFVLGADNRWKIALSAAASLAVYLGISSHWHNPGWATFFYCSTVQRCIHPISMPPALTANTYFDALAAGTAELIRDPVFILYLVMVAALLLLVRFRARATSWANVLRSPAVVLATVSLAYVVSRFLVLPAQWERFFIAPYLITALSLLAVTTEYAQAAKSVAPIERPKSAHPESR